MDDTLCQRFFLEPAQTLHRRFEVLRAFFVDHRSLQDIARQYGYAYGTLRNLVSEFRAQCQAGQIPPFSPSRATDDRSPTGLSGSPFDRRNRQSLTVAT